MTETLVLYADDRQVDAFLARLSSTSYDDKVVCCTPCNWPTLRETVGEQLTQGHAVGVVADQGQLNGGEIEWLKRMPTMIGSERLAGIMFLGTAPKEEL